MLNEIRCKLRKFEIGFKSRPGHHMFRISGGPLSPAEVRFASALGFVAPFETSPALHAKLQDQREVSSKLLKTWEICRFGAASEVAFFDEIADFTIYMGGINPNRYKNKGFKRVLRALFYSFEGIASTLKYEAAFRQGAILAAILIPISYFLGAASLVEHLILVGSIFLVLISLLNCFVCWASLIAVNWSRMF